MVKTIDDIGAEIEKAEIGETRSRSCELALGRLIGNDVLAWRDVPALAQVKAGEERNVEPGDGRRCFCRANHPEVGTAGKFSWTHRGRCHGAVEVQRAADRVQPALGGGRDAARGGLPEGWDLRADVFPMKQEVVAQNLMEDGADGIA